LKSGGKEESKESKQHTFLKHLKIFIIFCNLQDFFRYKLCCCWQKVFRSERKGIILFESQKEEKKFGAIRRKENNHRVT
jgi:hypothetical protein